MESNRNYCWIISTCCIGKGEMKVTLDRIEYSNKKIFENVLSVSYHDGLVEIRCSDRTTTLPVKSIVSLIEER